MTIAINDISFLKGFLEKKDVIDALIRFGKLCIFLQKEEVSGVRVERDIMNSPQIYKNLELAPGYLLIDALKDIRSIDEPMFRFLISVLTKCGVDVPYGGDEVTMAGISSRHCAFFRDGIFISLVSDAIFAGTEMTGTWNGESEIVLCNMAEQEHVYIYWEMLEFREYELNPKHGSKVYIRAGGQEVGIAPETDELGQRLLNCAIGFRGKLFSVDDKQGDRIFEFRRSYANKYHGFLQERLSVDEVRKIKKLWMEQE